VCLVGQIDRSITTKPEEEGNDMNKSVKNGLFVLFALMGAVMPSQLIWAHGGASVDVDTCRIPVAGHWVHFTAYTPQITADQEYCNTIPNVGRTNIVFDYEGKKLRNMTVEFEITKEPEGTRVYHQEPKTHKTGSVNAVIDFSQYGPGKYLAHVTLVNEGKRTDAHVPFTVGGGGAMGGNTTLIIILVVVGALVALYFLSPAFKEKVNGMLGGGGGAAAE
jgi:hypothetical protein